MDYLTYVGSSRRRSPAPDIYALSHREREDDGAVILHVGQDEPMCRDCGHGRLRWAEAGYVPWHRICDVCGSHWDLHPLGMGIGYVPIPDMTGSLPPSMLPPLGETPSQWRDGPGWVPLDPSMPITDEITATWGDLLALITPDMIEAGRRDASRTLSVPCVPVAWARRARFYRR